MEDELREMKKKIDQKQPVTEEKIEEYVESGIPVFIKVDRYEDLLSIVDEMKSFHSALMEVRRIMDEIESVRNSALQLMDKISRKIDERIAEMDSFLTRPKGLKLEKKSKEARDIDDALSRLKEELEQLKKEMGSIED